jgi:hypothetical protein
LASCIVNMDIQESNCNFSIYSTEPNWGIVLV